MDLVLKEEMVEQVVQILFQDQQLHMLEVVEDLVVDQLVEQQDQVEAELVVEDQLHLLALEQLILEVEEEVQKVDNLLVVMVEKELLF